MNVVKYDRYRGLSKRIINFEKDFSLNSFLLRSILWWTVRTCFARFSPYHLEETKSFDYFHKVYRSYVIWTGVVYVHMECLKIVITKCANSLYIILEKLQFEWKIHDVSNLNKTSDEKLIKYNNQVENMDSIRMLAHIMYTLFPARSHSPSITNKRHAIFVDQRRTDRFHWMQWMERTRLNSAVEVVSFFRRTFQYLVVRHAHVFYMHCISFCAFIVHKIHKQ